MKKENRKLALFIVLCVVFIDYFSIGVVYPLFSSLLFTEGAFFLPEDTSNTIKGLYLGVLLGTEPIFHFLSTPIFGAISDQYGRKKIILLSLSIGILGYIIAVFAIVYKSIVFLIFSRIFIGIGCGNSSVVQAAIVDMSKKEEKAKNFGLYNMALGIGFTVGPFLGGVLTNKNFISFASYNLPFLFALGFIVINLILVKLIFKESFTGIKKVKKFDILLGFKVLKKGFLMKDLRWLFVCAFIFVFGFSFFFEFMSVYLIKYFNFDSTDLGIYYGFASGIYAISSGLLIRPVVKRFSPNKIFFWALIAAGIGFFIATMIETVRILYIYIAIVEFSIALLFPTISTLISNKVGEEVQGETLGILQATIAFGFGVSPLFSGTIVGLYPIMPIIIGGVCMLLAAFIFKKIHLKKAKLHS